MSSIGKQTTKTGTRHFIQLSPGENKQRPKIHLGQVNRKQAESAQTYIADLIVNCKTGKLKMTTLDWLAGIPESLRERLEKLHLVEVRAGRKEDRADKGWTVANWIKHYIESRQNVKESTRRKWADVESKLAAFFQTDCIGDVTVEHAKNFRAYLQTTEGLGENTIRRHIGIARQFYNAAIDAELVAKNPFRGQSTFVRPDDSRFYFVRPETAYKVLEACSDAEWRLIFGLARFGGLRCPSEVLRLKWVDVDFEKQRFTVHASKTEHHADKGIRVVPMFPELKPLFQDAFDLAKERAVYCIEQYRGGEVNLRTQLGRIIKRADLVPWKKLFQNLRSTRETELFKMTGGNIKAVCKWIGNTPAVALAHYAQITEADMKRAAEKSIVNDAEKEVHNPVHEVQNQVQKAAETNRKEPKEPPEPVDVSLCNFGSCQGISGVCENFRKNQESIKMGSTGLEPVTSCL